MKVQNLKATYKKKTKNSKLFDIIIYFIFTATMILISPLIFLMVIRFLNINIAETSDAGRTNQNETNIIRARNYSYIERSLDLSVIENMGYTLITAHITNNADGILFCAQETYDERRGEILRIVNFENHGEIKPYRHFLSNHFLETIRAKEYVYKNYDDGYIYIANDRDAVLFDLENMRLALNYYFPRGYEIYQAVLSNDRTMLALVTSRGLFVDEAADESGMVTYPKELISAVENVSGVKTLPKYPVWSSDDEYIYYTLYADTYIKSAGRTPLSLGGNEQFPSLENTNFHVLNDGTIFYYFATSYQTSFENLFRCGYFNVNDRRMTDAIRSHIYYFDIKVSSEGTHLAALSYNGRMKKISIIDIKTKKNIYSALYEDIYEFEFSPNEKNIIIYGLKDSKEDLRIIEIDWEEE